MPRGPGMHREQTQCHSLDCALTSHPLGLSDRPDATRECAPWCLCAAHVLPIHASSVTKLVVAQPSIPNTKFQEHHSSSRAHCIYRWCTGDMIPPPSRVGETQGAPPSPGDFSRRYVGESDRETPLAPGGDGIAGEMFFVLPLVSR